MLAEADVIFLFCDDGGTAAVQYTCVGRGKKLEHCNDGCSYRTNGHYDGVPASTGGLCGRKENTPVVSKGGFKQTASDDARIREQHHPTPLSGLETSKRTIPTYER